MARVAALCLLALPVAGRADEPRTVWLDELELAPVIQGWGAAQAKKSIDGNPLKIGTQTFERGVGTHADSTMCLELDGKTTRFEAQVGVDSEVGARGTITFSIRADGKVIYESGPLAGLQAPKAVDVKLDGVKRLTLSVDAGADGPAADHADWAEARFTVEGAAPRTVEVPREKGVVLTPPAPLTPRINGPARFGVRPGSPFLYRIPATGQRPMSFDAKHLPAGLTIDKTTGVITGTIKNRKPTSHVVMLVARNGLGQSKRAFEIVVGDKLALTPPMGWNSWNCFASAVTADKVRSAARAMIASGLAEHGWMYINIDDFWSVKPTSDDETLHGPDRTPEGRIATNPRFPNMKGLVDDIHALGLRAGIYSSPGPLTCGECIASYQHEMLDAQQYAEWGFDYLKYDWCTYGRVAPGETLQDLMKPYLLMGDALRAQPRDIVYSLCQYGMGNVSAWGHAVDGNLWRTTGDIVDNWQNVTAIGFGQNGLQYFAEPGRWNDPDMLVVGKVGWGPALHDSRLTPNEQYTHISLWCMMAAPLLIGCDLTQLDPFTLNLLTNDEVLAIDQDPLGRQGWRAEKQGPLEVWKKPLADGGTAVALFNLGDDPARVTANWSALGLTGRQAVRDLWRQQELGEFDASFSSEVARHGVTLVKMTATQGPSAAAH